MKFRIIALIVCLLSACPLFAAANDMDGYRVIRCQFDEKKIVVTKSGRITVLTEKEKLPDTDIVVLRIEKKQAILEKKDRAGRKEYILLEEKDGSPVLRILKNHTGTQPTFPATAPPVIVQQTQTSKAEKKD